VLAHGHAGLAGAYDQGVYFGDLLVHLGILRQAVGGQSLSS
jgi:hypothetical protein